MTDKQFADKIREWQRKLDQLRGAQRGTVKLRRIRVTAYRVPAHDVAAHDRYIVDRRDSKPKLRLVG